MTRLLCSMSVFALTLALLATPSFAVEKPATSQVTDDCPKDMTAPKFMRLLEQYPPIYKDGTKNLEQWSLEDQITNAVFCAVGTKNYVAYLKELDKLAPKDQEPYYNLAKRLQAHWESQYALGLAKVQRQRMQNVVDTTRVLSLAATALGWLGKTSSVPNYFSLIRTLFPIIAPGLAVESTNLITRSGMFDHRFPVSPAHIILLPLPEENLNYDSYQVVRDLTTATASVAGAQLAVAAVRYFELGATIGKTTFNPVTILASIAVGAAVQKSAGVAIDSYQFHRLRDKVLQYQKQLEQAVREQNYVEMRTAAENFRNSAILLSSFLDRESLDVWVKYDRNTAKTGMNSEWKELLGSAVMMETGKFPDFALPSETYHSSELKKHELERDQSLEAIAASQDPECSQDVMLAIALNVMHSGLDSTDGLTGELKAQSDLIAKGYQLYLQDNAPLLSEGQKSYQSYIENLEANKDHLLASELRAGQIHRNPTHVLLQAAAFIRSLKQPILTSVGDDLLNIIYSGELLK